MPGRTQRSLQREPRRTLVATDATPTQGDVEHATGETYEEDPDVAESGELIQRSRGDAGFEFDDCSRARRHQALAWCTLHPQVVVVHVQM